jgi:hypothetical protein
MRYLPLDDPESSIKWKLTEIPLHYTITSVSTSLVNMMIKGVQYWYTVGFFKDYVYTMSINHDEKGKKGAGGTGYHIIKWLGQSIRSLGILIHIWNNVLIATEI